MADPATPLSGTTTQDILASARAAANSAASPLIRGLDLAAGPSAFKVSHASGARVVDRHGTSYLDLCMGYGALVLGHGAATVKEALAQQLEAGWLYGLSHAKQDQLAELIKAAGSSNERVAFCDSASDATLLALRAARAFTGRDKIAVFSQAHHGLHDFALISDRAAPRAAANDAQVRQKVHVGAGIPAALDDFVIILRYGDPGAIDWIRSYAGQLAAVIAEPFPSRFPSLRHKAWLQDVQAICRTTHTLFVLDENISGFRLGYGGAQSTLDLSPDLVTYGNALGGGLSIGAVAGREPIMEGFGATAPEQRIFSGSAHAGNPLSTAAAVAVLEVLLTHRDTVYPQLNGAAVELAAAFNTAAETVGVPATMSCAGSVFAVRFDTGHEALERAFYAALFARKVIVHASKRCFLSTAHTVGDIQDLAAAFSDSLSAARKAR
jgi:glutamate-1-semialdehyde 2,1-aminomutase